MKNKCTDAELLFSNQIESMLMESKLEDMLNILDSIDKEHFQWDDYAYDYYDGSITIYCSPPYSTLSRESLKIINDYGFKQVFLRYSKKKI